MSVLYTEKSIKVCAVAGTNLQTAVNESVELSNQLNCTVVLNFNDTNLYAQPGSDADVLVNCYYRINSNT